MAQMVSPQYDNNNEDWWWAVILFVAGWFALSCLTSCGMLTKTVTVTTTDTLIINRQDTIRVITHNETRDTIKEIHSYFYNINEKGDTTGTKEVHNAYHGVRVADSTAHYKSLYEALLQSQNHITEKQTPTPVQKERTWATGILDKFKDLLLIAFAVILFLICFKLGK